MKNGDYPVITIYDVVQENVGDMEDNTREGIIRVTWKEVVVCVLDVSVKKNFLVQFKYG